MLKIIVKEDKKFKSKKQKEIHLPYKEYNNNNRIKIGKEDAFQVVSDKDDHFYYKTNRYINIFFKCNLNIL